MKLVRFVTTRRIGDSRVEDVSDPHFSVLHTHLVSTNLHRLDVFRAQPGKSPDPWDSLRFSSRTSLAAYV